MTKANIPQYSATAASNTDVQDIDIAENCAPSGINNAIREIMADLKDQDTGAVAMTSPVLTTADINGGTADNITIGGSTPAAGTFTTVTTSGEITANGGIALGDNDKATFGAGDDLQIYHNANNSFIQDAGTGSLYIDGSASVNIRETSTNAPMAVLTGSGSVDLYHNGIKKIATSATGINVTGSVVADGLTVDGDASISSTNARLRLFETDTTDLNTQLQNQAGDFNISRLDDDAGASTLQFNIDHATGNVSIPNGNLDVTGDVNTSGLLKVGTNDTEYANNYIRFKPTGAAFIDHSTVGQAINFRLSNASSLDKTVMTLSSAGDVLVGKSTTAFGTQGIRLEGNNGKIESTRNGNVVMALNRLTSDGTISEFAKNGTTVGSIGNIGNDLTAGSGDVALRFSSGNNDIRPWNVTTNAVQDATISIGASNGRFEDLYLSGGVYLGGTGAANKLDDYEEGTYTVQLFDASYGGNASSSSVTGYYTKIGNQVTVRFSALNNISTSGMTGANDLSFSLPFVAGSTGRSVGSIIMDNLNFTTGRNVVAPLVLSNEPRGQLITMGDGVTDANVNVEDITSGQTDIHTFTLTYFTA